MSFLKLVVLKRGTRYHIKDLGVDRITNTPAWIYDYYDKKNNIINRPLPGDIDDVDDEEKDEMPPPKVKRFYHRRVRNTNVISFNESPERVAASTLNAVPLRKSSVNNWVKAIVDFAKYLHKANIVTTQKLDNVRGEALKVLIRNVGEARKKFDRSTEVDRGKTLLSDQYTSKELHEVAEFCWKQNSLLGLRDLVDFLLSHVMLLRGESVRIADLADLRLVNMHDPVKQGAQYCAALVLTMDTGKTIEAGKVEVAGALRATDVMVS